MRTCIGNISVCVFVLPPAKQREPCKSSNARLASGPSKLRGPSDTPTFANLLFDVRSESLYRGCGKRHARLTIQFPATRKISFVGVHVYAFSARLLSYGAARACCCSSLTATVPTPLLHAVAMRCAENYI